jgi:hypothetical protein
MSKKAGETSRYATTQWQTDNALQNVVLISARSFRRMLKYQRMRCTFCSEMSNGPLLKIEQTLLLRIEHRPLLKLEHRPLLKIEQSVAQI